MSRREFPRSVKIEVVKRATRGGVVYCEACELPARKWQIDHVRADGLGGEPKLANAMLICEACFGIKNPDDARKIAKAKRREAKHLGVVKSARPIRSAPMVTTERAARRRANPKPSLPPRPLFEDA